MRNCTLLFVLLASSYASQNFAAVYPMSALLTLNVGGEDVPVPFCRPRYARTLCCPRSYSARSSCCRGLSSTIVGCRPNHTGVTLTIQPAPNGTLRAKDR